MLSLGTEIGNMPLSSILEMSNTRSSGSIGWSESEPISNESMISVYSSKFTLLVDVPSLPLSLCSVLSILAIGLDAIDMGMLTSRAASSTTLPMRNTGSLPRPLIQKTIPSSPGELSIDVSNL